MGWFSRDDEKQDRRQDQQGNLTDEQAVERYRYMLRTAAPDQIEKAHEEAFARLTPDQRRLALEQLSSALPPEELRDASEDSRSLARVATRAEIRQPGMLERLFGGGSRMGGVGGMGMGMGGMFAGSLLASLAGTFIASSIAHSFFDAHPFSGAGIDGRDDNVLNDNEDTEAAGYEDASIDDMDADSGDFDGGGDFGDFA